MSKLSHFQQETLVLFFTQLVQKVSILELVPNHGGRSMLVILLNKAPPLEEEDEESSRLTQHSLRLISFDVSIRNRGTIFHKVSNCKGKIFCNYSKCNVWSNNMSFQWILSLPRIGVKLIKSSQLCN